ncbi:hypothetical protein AOR13_1642 [Alteromonas stellipolaris LMG 21856]|nr:hypothetical protein AOR13_1642 [Alteromonas stellipolaris LMG 21856]
MHHAALEFQRLTVSRLCSRKLEKMAVMENSHGVLLTQPL